MNRYRRMITVTYTQKKYTVLCSRQDYETVDLVRGGYRISFGGGSGGGRRGSHWVQVLSMPPNRIIFLHYELQQAKVRF